MPELLVALPDVIGYDDGIAYRAQVLGLETPGGHWEAWVEFVPIDGGAPIHSPRETTQPNRAAAVYWATGLTAVYLEGALTRALQQAAAGADGGTRHTRKIAHDDAAVGAVAQRDAVLDPFSVYAKGESVLRRELAALAPWHLVNIIVAYELSSETDAALNTLPAAALIETIVSRVRRETPTRG